MSARRAVRVRIRGRVQRVGFRAWTVRAAERLGLAGWVANRADGSVEAVLAGPPEAVAAMLVACREGPRHARVETVETAETDAETVPQDAGFRVRRG